MICIVPLWRKHQVTGKAWITVKTSDRLNYVPAIEFQEVAVDTKLLALETWAAG